MFIMRGLPGSGKSTIVRHIRDKYQPITDVVVCSADDYFLQEDGNYNYDKVGSILNLSFTAIPAGGCLTTVYIGGLFQKVSEATNVLLTRCN